MNSVVIYTFIKLKDFVRTAKMREEDNTLDLVINKMRMNLRRWFLFVQKIIKTI